ncbi:MAG: class I SAM-dependent methyltransferase [Planctomycetes bacterium]|nr:class I SAM-dependent methyltransferase [Planctomycetota bacterium]
MASNCDKEARQAPFHLDRCGDLTELPDLLRQRGYTQSAMGETMRMDDDGRPGDTAAALRRTAEPSPYHTLVRLFLMGRDVPTDAVDDALGTSQRERLVAAGLLHETPRGIRCEAALLPYDDLLVARDLWPEYTGRPMAPDYVLGVGPASQAVANLTVRRPVDAALDLGTGSGVQALLTASHAGKVVATDTNPRALAFAALNARLNGIDNIELRCGSLYEPVADDRFDLIVSNPPFVISPRTEFEYCDGGLQGDSLSQQVIGGAPELLREGGFATVLFNWHHRDESDWAQRPKQWVASRGCDAWLICSDTADPLNYAASWLRNAAVGDVESSGRLLDRWLDYYRRLDIGRISTGAILLRRRRAERNWFRTDRESSGPPQDTCSDQIPRIFAAADLLEELTDDNELLDMTFVLTPDHQLQHSLALRDGTWQVERAQLRQTRGFPFIGNVDRSVSTVLAGCDGRRPLRKLVSDLAGSLGADPQQVSEGCIKIIRTMLETGFLSRTDGVGTGD